MSQKIKYGQNNQIKMVVFLSITQQWNAKQNMFKLYRKKISFPINLIVMIGFGINKIITFGCLWLYDDFCTFEVNTDTVWRII